MIILELMSFFEMMMFFLQKKKNTIPGTTELPVNNYIQVVHYASEEKPLLLPISELKLMKILHENLPLVSV